MRGLDFIVLCKKYPPFLAKNAPKWDTQADRVTTGFLLYAGAVLTLGGALMTYFGVRNLVLDLYPPPPLR